MKANDIMDKYPCKKCGERAMRPNKDYGFVKGFKCVKCGAVNYPVKDAQ